MPEEQPDAVNFAVSSCRCQINTHLYVRSLWHFDKTEIHSYTQTSEVVERYIVCGTIKAVVCTVSSSFTVDVSCGVRHEAVIISCLFSCPGLNIKIGIRRWKESYSFSRKEKQSWCYYKGLMCLFLPSCRLSAAVAIDSCYCARFRKKKTLVNPRYTAHNERHSSTCLQPQLRQS
jgi:hypothetical protein